jgi:hypothetical protein
MGEAQLFLWIQGYDSHYTIQLSFLGASVINDQKNQQSAGE